MLPPRLLRRTLHLLLLLRRTLHLPRPRTHPFRLLPGWCHLLRVRIHQILIQRTRFRDALPRLFPMPPIRINQHS